MPDTPQFLAERLRVEGEKTLGFFRSIPKEKWEMVVYTEGSQWHLRDVIAHFVSSEISFLQLFRRIQAGGSSLPDDFSVDRFNEAQVSALRDRAVERLLDDFHIARRETVEWVGKLSSVEAGMVGKHPFLGSTTLVEMIKMIYLHNNLHLRDIRRLLATQG